MRHHFQIVAPSAAVPTAYVLVALILGFGVVVGVCNILARLAVLAQ